MNHIEQLPQQLLQLLRQHPEGLGEYQIIKTLRQQCWPVFVDADLRDPLSLFRTHFILFHALYLLDEQLARQDLQLQIHTLSIRLLPRVPGKPGLARQDPLRSYYLDLQQLADTDRLQVEAMLNGSLRRIHGHGELQQALACLGFDGSEQPPAPAQIRYSFRQLVSQHHPDRGGNTERLQQINHAMAVIKKHGLTES